MKCFAMLAALMFVLGSTLSLAAEEEGLKVGDAAPDFELQGSDGMKHKLSDFKDKQAVVIAWFPRAFTGGCTKECKSFAQDGEKIKAFNVAYFTASTDDAEKNKKFAESVGADYAILSDPTGATAKAYGIYNADRNAAARVTFFVGKDGKLLFIDKAVKTDTHAGDVAAKLKELGVEAKK